MDWLKRMNDALDYIELNLSDDISYDRIAQLACCSKYHFQRMFPFITGVTLSEYIRRRRLTMAAFELQSTDIKVVDVAVKYGYDSSEAFARAFRQLHGVMPTAARGIGISLKAYPRMTFQISVKGDVEMNYRIERRDSFKVFGVYTEISTDSKTAFEQVPQFCRKCDEDRVPDDINELLGRFHDNYTISALYDFSETTFKYMLCNYLPKGLSIPSKFTTLTIPSTTWAIFDVPGCDMQSMWRRVWTEWFPTSGYEMAEGAQFEMYYGLARHENAFGEIWVPVRKK